MVCLIDLHALIYPLYFIYVVGILQQARDYSQQVFEIMAESFTSESQKSSPHAMMQIEYLGFAEACNSMILSDLTGSK